MNSSRAQFFTVIVFCSDMRMTALLNLSVINITELNPSDESSKVRIKSMIIT